MEPVTLRLNAAGDSDLGGSRDDGDLDLPPIPTVELCLPSLALAKPGKVDRSPEIAAAIAFGG